MRTVLRVLLWTLAVFAVLTAGAYAYLRNADLSVYEKQIEGFLSGAIGHKIDFDGLFELHFGMHTELTAEQIRLTNYDWEPDSEIVSVGRLSVTVDLWSLFSGPIIIEDLEIHEIRIRLEKDDEGRANWDSDKVPKESQEKGGFNPELIRFKEVQIQDVQFALLDPARRRPLDIEIEHLTVNPDQNQILDLDLNAVINEIPLRADGRLGPWENLLDGNNIVADLDMTLGQVRIAIDGSVENLPNLIGTELSLKLNGPAIDRVTDTLGLPPFAEGAFKVDGRILKLDVGSELRLEGNLGAIEIFATGTADSLIKFGTAELDFKFSGPDTQYVAEVFGVDGAPAVPFLVTGDVSKKGSRVTFSGTRAQLGENALGLAGWLDFKDTVPDGDLTVNAFGPDLSVVGPFAGITGIPAKDFDIDGRVQKSGKSLRFDDVEAIIGENRILANGAIGERGSTDTEVNIRATGPDISILGPMTGLEGIQARPFDISAVVKPDPAGIRIENATGDFGEIQIGVDGVVGTAKGLTGTDLRLRAEGTDLRYVALLAGVPYLPDGPFMIGARARLSGNELRLSEGTAEVGGMDGNVSGSVSLGANAGAFDLDLSVNGPDLADALQFEWLDRLSGEAFFLEGRVKHRAGKYELNSVSASISDFEINVDGDFEIADTTGDITLSASAPDPEELRKLIGLAYLPEGGVYVSGRIEKQDDKLEFSDVIASVGKYSVGADGTLSNSPLSNRSDLEFSASGAELREIGLMFDYENLPAKPFTVYGELNGIPTGFALEKFAATIGENNVDARFTADLRGKPEITGGLSSSFIDLASQLQASDVEETDVEETTEEFLLSDEPLDAEWLDAANIDLSVKTDRLILRHVDLKNFHIGIRLWDGDLDIDPVSFRELEGNVSGSLHLGPENGAYGFDVAVNVENMHVGLLASKDQERSTVPPVDGQIEIKSTGRSLHELASSSNGRVFLTQGEGQLKDLITSKLFGDLLLQVIRTLNPMQKAEEYTTLHCGVYAVNIEDGVATIENFAIQSDRLAFIAKGNVNFENEKLNLTMRAAPREGLGISLGGVANSFFKLGGTLRSPKLRIDPKASATTTGAAVATGGLSLIARGLWDRVKAANDICEDLAPQ